MSLKRKAGSGFFWVAIERLGQQGLAGITFIILARLLTPEDFGLIGMLMIFIGVSQSFIDSGMGQALIRKKEITDQDRSTVFWLNLFLSFVFYGLLYFAAPFIAAFYDQPELTNLTRFMGLTVIFNGIAIVQRSELTQRLEFKKQTYAQIPALLISAIVSIGMAYLGYGVWAIASQFVLTAFLSSILLWVMAPAKILISWDKETFISLFNFGYKLLISGLLHTTYEHIYKLVIGKYFLASTLGFYTQAQRLQQLASQTLVGIIQKVTYPLLAKTSDDPVRLKHGYRQIITGSSFIIFPGMLILILFAKPIMQYILGEQWISAAPFLQLLCISGILHHLHAINLNILKVLGRTDLYLKLEIIKKINITIAIIIGLQFGIYGLLIGQVVASYVALFINAFYTSKFLNYSLLEQGGDVLKVLMLSLPMIFIVFALLTIFNINSLSILIGYLVFSGIIYIITNLLYRTKVTEIVLDLLAPYLPLKFKRIFHI